MIEGDVPKETPDSNQQFVRDVRRSIILGAYVRHWGMPEYRKIGRSGIDQIEVYSFPSTERAPVYRIATVGISSVKKNSHRINKELLMALPHDLGGATRDEVFDFMLNVTAHVITVLDDTDPPRISPESPLAPKEWKPKALLFDQARSEPEELSELAVGSHVVELLWVVPIYNSEYRFISEQGIEAFDALAGKAELSLADVNRDPFVS